MNLTEAKSLLLRGDPAFWKHLASLTVSATGFDDLIFLSTLRKKALARGLAAPARGGRPLRLAIVGGCSLYPLHELLAQLIDAGGQSCEMFLGDYDNYVAEILDEGGALYRFAPDVVVLLPSAQRCCSNAPLTAAREAVHAEAEGVAMHLHELCQRLHQRAKAEVILVNFMLPARHDPGACRSRIPASDWTFRKWVNLELGLRAPSYVQVCDLEFLACRHGALAGEDPRGWFESKQPCSPELMVELAREIAHLVRGRVLPPKKVLVLDLDNTLWGGVVAEDGLGGIEIGDTSPRGEAFKALQKSILALKQRGVLLAVCSKNDHTVAMEPFEKHPEMVLHPGDFVSFKANWEPKSDNLRQMAAELNLGLDSFVFVDDNPAEIEIVRQFTPSVTAILLDPDPADRATQLQDCRLFEPRGITAEDLQRSGQYQAESQRRELLGSAADMDSYLASLAMEATFCEFRPVDAPRLSQLINKSNQFNLTTRRRTEAEVLALIGEPDCVCFSVRLRDRFGDHGLISVIIGRSDGRVMEIDTWLMSCRVLKRQVEEAALHELARLARARGCSLLKGIYLATPKNEMVRDFYPRIGFQTRVVTPERGEFTLALDTFQPRPTKISIQQLAYEPA